MLMKSFQARWQGDSNVLIYMGSWAAGVLIEWLCCVSHAFGAPSRLNVEMYRGSVS